MSDYLDEVIEHYGVKGMKWGVRKDPDRVAARKQANMERKENIKKYVGDTTSSLTTRAKEQKHKFQTKRADKKWAKGMSQDRINKEMKNADIRTKEQQAKAFNKLSKTDTFKKAQSGDPFATMQLNFEWTAEYATILNSDFAKQAELKSPSGKQAIEVTLTQIGGQPLMKPQIVNKE